ncbi:PstS family phosphate ABC transporter substrate-binding protein [Sulfurospirillum sp. T05]|uniref:PstS family phosphate ABC transporter substrate-binding protein n=1 Tax=Sulfurospirillum tamanense TaxID=2813362 RepID=A0ABS2WNN9_9BACT|nr:PstS family phosphate ABC transporter substrate-binding protein [Sulfurospirillum tamanensis]MBN2963216.1 PstS family phosphate ABC transporter substrate-binding protein [Sulfurospirillum tamanensis]
MTLLKRTVLAAAAVAVVVGAAQARDQIRITGSSTVYPFSSYVAEEFGATTGNPTPVVESTGSGGGMKIFCSGNGLDTPDFTNASRAMKLSEFELCQANGVKNITGVVIGFDGISIAQSKTNPKLDLTLEQVFLALAEEVPSKDGKSLVKNPYKKWSDIDPKLPNREIKMIGAPTTSGTRDAFDEMVMEKASKSFEAYGKQKGKYKKVRSDGAFIPGGENDNLIVQRLEQDKDAVGYFGYSFLEENHDKISGVTLGGIEPNFDNIASGKYPVARSLFFYAKTDHFGKVKGMEDYLDLFVSDMMIGKDGVLKTIGLIPMPEATLKKVQASVKARTPLTEDMVKKGVVTK